MYEEGYEWAVHSLWPRHIDENDTTSTRVTIGGPSCKQPYSASILNISAMSYGALSDNAILALNRGAKMGGFYHNTGEGGISRFRRSPALRAPLHPFRRNKRCRPMSHGRARRSLGRASLPGFLLRMTPLPGYSRATFHRELLLSQTTNPAVILFGTSERVTLVAGQKTARSVPKSLKSMPQSPT